MMIGIEGLSLNANEKKFITENNISGVTLFSRNIESPEQLSELNKELQDFFGLGLVVSIDVPNFEAMVGIVLNKTSNIDIEISHDVAICIVNYAGGSIAELYFGLSKVLFHVKQSNTTPTESMVNELLGDSPFYKNRTKAISGL